MMPGFLSSTPSCSQDLQQQWDAWNAAAMVGVQQQQHVVHAHSEVPNIADMLYREGDAWRALLSLHGSVLQFSRGVAEQSVASHLAEALEASEQREASYVASVSQLLMTCDQIAAEIIKIRGLRKAKHHLEQQCLRDVIRAHADETLATGEAVARNCAFALTAAAAEMRTAAQQIRTQIQQSRALLQASTELREAGAPVGYEFVMGYRLLEDGVETLDVKPVSQVLENVYQRGTLNNQNLSDAIVHGSVTRTDTVTRTFSRRASCARQRSHQIDNATSEDTPTTPQSASL